MPTGRAAREVLQLGFLGPVEAWRAGARLALGGPKPRLILSLLAIDAGRAVPTGTIADALWPRGGPVDPRATIQVNLSNLRRALGDGEGPRIEHRGAGYVLVPDGTEVDLHRFASLVAAGSSERDPHRAATQLRDGLRLWRGRPFGDLADEPALVGEVRRLEEFRLRALEKRIAADLALGYVDDLLDELPTLVEANPLREALWGQLALAQYRAGLQADALTTYDRARRVLADELGVDPSAALRELHTRILRQDPTLAAPGDRSPATTVAAPLRTVRGYALHEEVRVGALGTVHAGRQPGTGRTVAVEVVDRDIADTPRFIERFEARTALVARLDHPGIARLEDHWREPGAAYLVTDTVAGAPLVDTLRRGPWNPTAAASLIDAIAAALDHAHDHGITHPCVTTASIALDEDDRPVITDLAAAVVGSEDLPTPTQRLRHLAWLALDLLTGHRPSDTTARGATPRSVLAEVRPDLPAAVGRVLDRAATSEAGERFASANDVAVAFRAAVTGDDPTLLSSDIRNPYKGLRAFREGDQSDFFGRDGVVGSLLDRLEHGRFLALVGPSGSGKSSVVRAGLVPAVRDGRLRDGDRWLVATMTPGEWPMAELERTVTELATRDTGDVADLLDADRGLSAAVAAVLPDADTRLLLVVDQFEELFALARHGDRRAFLDQLASAIEDDGCPLYVAVTVRADFYDQLLLDPAIGAPASQRTVALTPLTPEELERAVAAPAEAVGLRVEPELIAAAVAEVAAAPSSLPLLQYALTELCDARDGDTLRLADYRRLGGLHGALAGRAESLYDALDADEQRACRQIFLRLVAVDDGVVETRRRVLRPELRDVGTGEVGDALLETFGTHRLLTFDHDPFTRVPTVEVAHEALTRAWGRLRGWIDAARDDLVMHRRLVVAADEWRLADHDPSHLLRGGRLDELAAWADTASIALTEVEGRFLEDSLRAREERNAAERARRAREHDLERRAIRRLRTLVAVLAIGIVAAAGLSVFALQQRSSAHLQRAAAEEQERIATARELAAAAVAELETDPERSLLLAIEAAETSLREDEPVLAEAESALHRALRASLVEAVHPTGGGVAVGPDGLLAMTGVDGVLSVRDGDGLRFELRDRPSAPLALPGDNIPETFLERTADVDFSPDGTRLATADRNFTIEVRDVSTGDVQVRLDRPAIRPVFSPDGRWIVAVVAQAGTSAQWDAGRTLGLWDAESGALVREFEGGGRGILDHAFSPDGARLASTDPMDGTVRMWDTETGELLATADRPEAKAVAFAPDGATLVVAGGDARAEIRDADTLEELQVFHGHDGDLFAVAFSPDGDWVASAGNEAAVWDPRTGEQILSVVGHTATIADLEFRADGSRLVTSAEDGTTRVWDVSVPGGREVAALEGPPPPALGTVAFDPAGERLAAPGRGEIRLHQTGTWEVLATLPIEAGAVGDLTFSPDGSRVAAGEFDPPPGPGVEGTLVIWDSTTGERLVEVPGHGGIIWDIAFSPDGSLVATGTDDEGVVRVLDAASGEQQARYRLAEGSVSSVEFIGDGDGLFVGGQDAGYIIDPRTGEQVRAFAGADESILDDRLTRDGELVTGDIAGRVQVWDPARGVLLRTLLRDSQGVGAVAEADGLVAAATVDGVALLDLATGERRLDLGTGHARGAWDLALSPDGRYLATAGGDGTVRLFVTSAQDLLELARSRLTRTFTEEECQRFLHVDQCPDPGPAPAAASAP